MVNKQNNLVISDIEKNEGINSKPYVGPDYPLTEWYNVVRKKRISELNDSDISKFIRQGLFLKYIVPEALRRLRKDPTIGELYCGEVLAALHKIDDAFWKDNKFILHETQNLLTELMEEVDITKDFEWLYEDEEQEFYNRIKLLSERLSRAELNIIYKIGG